MVQVTKFTLLSLTAALLVTTLSACGGSSSSSPTTIPSSATIYYAHNLVFRNSTTLLSTGYNGFGQLGFSNGDGGLGNRSTPGPLDQQYSFAGAAAGGNHSVAFFNESTVRSWGYNAFGQLGIGNVTTTHSKVPVKTVDISKVTAVAAGALHSLALKRDGTVWAWGSNDAGQLGASALASSLVPLQVGSGPPLANITAIAANGKHSLALDNSGRVAAWGYNGSGQIGVDPAGTGATNFPQFVAGLPAAGIAGIAAGSAFNYAIAKDAASTLWAWGNNDNGQLGNNSVIASFTPVQVLTAPGTPLTGVKQAAAGIQHGLALLSDGTVWAWGYNHFGQLGNNASADSSLAVKVNLPSGKLATEIRAFGSSSMAKIEGSWYVWGDNAYGQLGLGTVNTDGIKVPVKMLGF